MMLPDTGLHWCQKCERVTYWHKLRCQRCKLVRQERERGLLIVLGCIFIIIATVAKLWWGR